MKNALWIFLALYSASIIVACGTNGDDNDAPSVAAQVGCPSGTTLYMGYCVNANGVPQDTGSLAFQGGTHNSQGSLSISNRGNFEKLLKEGMAACDQGGYNSGVTACVNFKYVTATLQAVNVDASAARMTLEAWPVSRPNGYYSMSSPSFGQFNNCLFISYFFGGCVTKYQVARNPLLINMSLTRTNNGTGFEARGFGGYGANFQTKLIKLVVPSGKLTDNFVDYQLFYNNTDFATGRMVRCTNPSCGLMN